MLQQRRRRATRERRVPARQGRHSRQRAFRRLDCGLAVGAAFTPILLLVGGLLAAFRRRVAAAGADRLGRAAQQRLERRQQLRARNVLERAAARGGRRDRKGVVAQGVQQAGVEEGARFVGGGGAGADL